MQREQHAQEEEIRQKAKKKTETYAAESYKCGNCGAHYGANDRFCSECGMALGGNTCPHCGAATQPDREICDVCGGNLSAGECSFCGGAMGPDDAFCPECGNPRTGIVCDGCHTLNFRSFCRKCNTPLNEAARQALSEARKDPKVKKAVALARELEELQQILTAYAEEEGAVPELPEISAENKELLDQYKDLLAVFRGGETKTVTKEPEPDTPPKEQPVKPKLKFSVEIASKEDAIQKYKEKMAEMQEALSAMIPDAGMTPQMQRDFYCARKVGIREPGKVYWECTAYGCLHDAPNQCTKPWKGGVWKYVPDEDIVIVWGGPF